MRAASAGGLEAYLKGLFRVRRRRSASFETFRFSFFGDRQIGRDGLNIAALLCLRNRERECAERMLIAALPDLRAVTGLGAMRSRRAERRLVAIFEAECAAAQAACVAADREWRADPLVAVAHALWRIEPKPRYARTLIGTLECAQTWTERTDAARALAEMPSLEVEAALMAALNDRDALVRHHAARGLLMIHGVEFDARAANHMIYRVMANDPERCKAGQLDVIAVLDGRLQDAPPSAPISYSWRP